MKYSILLLLVFLFTACQAVLPSTQITSLNESSVHLSTDTVVQPSNTPLLVTKTPYLPTETISLPTVTIPPTSSALPACITVYYEEYAQVELIDLDGTRVMVDVYDPALLSTQATEDDILLTTHTHWDHFNADFQQGFPGKQLLTQTGRIASPGVNILGIASAHNAEDVLKPKGGTNYIYLIEMGGLRIAHLGDIGQDALRDDQLVALGAIDIAITQLANAYSDMDAENQKGLKLVAQLNPRLVLPTHINVDTAKLAVAQWPGLYTKKESIHICESDLPQTTQILFMGQSAATFVKYLDLGLVDW